jgi:hypothetical protein
MVTQQSRVSEPPALAAGGDHRRPRTTTIINIVSTITIIISTIFTIFTLPATQP